MDEDRRLASYKLEQKDFIIEVKKAEAREQKPEVGPPPSSLSRPLKFL